MRTSKRNRFLAALLAMVMIFTLLPLGAFAEDIKLPAAAKVNVTDASDITAGAYLISGISANKIDDGSDSAFMSAKGSTATRLMSAQCDAVNDTVESYDKECVWNLIETEGGFYVQNADNEKYLYYGSNSGNNIYQTSDVKEAGVWTVVANGDFWTLQEVASGRQLSANRFGSAGSYYFGFAAYVSTSSCKRSLEFYRIGETAKNHVIESLDELTDGAQVVIYNPANMMALSSVYSVNYNSGVELTEENGKLSGFEETELWTVAVNDDGTYSFATADGKKLSMDTQYSSMPLDKVNDTWIVAETDGGYFINNVGRDDANSYRMEWYADKNNWSCYYKNNDGDLFVQQFYLVTEPLEDVETVDPTDPVIPAGPLAAGDKVVIYNPANMKALSSEYTGNYNAGVDVTMKDGVLSGFYDTEVWVVGVNSDGTYTFATVNGAKKLSMGASYSSTPLDDINTAWEVTSAKTEGYYYIKNTARGNYLEWYADKNDWSSYSNNSNEALFAQCFYKITGEISGHDTGDLPKDGEQVVIYNASAGAVFGMPNELNTALDAAPAFISNGILYPDNGARVFTVGVSGNDYTFKSGNLYLASDDAENLFLTDDETAHIKWNLVKGTDGYVIYSKDSKYTFSGGSTGKVCIEFYAGSFSGWTYKSADKDIFEMQFYSVAEGTNVVKGIVDNPEAVRVSGDAYIGMDYELQFSINAIFGYNMPSITFNGEPITQFSMVNFITVKIPAEKVVGDELVFVIEGSDKEGVPYDTTFKVPVNDEPVVTELTPSASSVTGDNKRPVISAKIVNGGENPTVTMTVNKKDVDTVFENGVISYTPAKDMADGKVTVTVNVTREDGKSTVKTWTFNVGKVTYQLYFGQLHSHTAEYSDGAGTLQTGLDYIKNLPESANVQFVAFTDHSNYFDSSSAVNPEQALYDMSLASAASQEKWAKYKSTIAAFNEEQSDVIALGGFEMTWSGGPGHINTFNTPGIVSRNNSTLNNKTNDSGMKAYYALLSQEEGAGSISQFNHPGSTFGNFADFAYWDAVIDSRVFLVEVGNGEGPIGAGGYYPSYEQYIMALDKGWHVAPTNNQDNHKGKWGNANDARDVILTNDFSEEGIYRALRNMNVYSTEDKNLELYYTINDNINEYDLGSSITEVPDELNIQVSVNDPDFSDNIIKVEVVVNSGKVAYTWDNPADLASGVLSVTLAPDYSYYFIRVTEGDGDLAVTAPIWVGESLKLGISSLECGTSTPVTGEELTLSTTVFNSEASEATIKSVVYTADGGKVIGTDNTGYTVPAGGSSALEFKYTPDAAKVMTVTATVIIEQDGKEFSFTKDITLDILNADDLAYIGIDASHYNEYVAGNYSDSMGNFGELAAGYSVRTVELKTSDDLIAACDNDKFKAIILTAPSRRLAAAQENPASYSADEIAAINAFNANGGVVILAGWSDYYENYALITGNPDIKHMSETQNEVLSALGSSLRINDDATNDDSLNGGQTQRLYFNTYNMDSFLMNGVEVDEEHPNDRLYSEVFSQYGGCSIYAVDAQGEPTATLADSVTPVVFGHSSTYTKDSDSDGKVDMKYSFADGDNRVLVLASEQLEGRGLIVVSGAAFMSNFEVQATISDNGSEKNYSNYKVCENLVQFINPISVTDIADVQKQTETGYKYTIEGVVTTNASGYDKDTAFFDCIYVQDETGGVCCFPVAGNYKIGDKVRITGTTDFYQGEMELQVSSIQKIGEGETVTAKEVSAADINDLTVLGQFISLKGTVQSFALENGLVQTIMVKDAKGDVARVFIDGYICADKDIENLKNGCEITVMGVASYDDTFNAPEGPFPRIRVNDRDNIVVGNLVEDPFTDIAGNGHHDNIVEAANAGIINGYEEADGSFTFRPKAVVTRAQFITMLWRSVGSPEAKGTLSFADAGTVAAPFKDAVIWGVQNGIIAGYENNTFRPNQNISRAQMATFLYRYLKNVADYDFGEVSAASFADAGYIAGAYKDAVNAIVSAGIMKGVGDGTYFAPTGTANRGMAATVILRVYNLLHS